MKNKIVTGFSSLTDAGFLNKAQAINSSMTGNANFPDASPSLAEITTAIQAYSTALTAAVQSRSRNDVAVKNEKRNDLNDLLTSLAGYVNFVADGDKTMLVSSGYDLAKEGDSTPLQKPDNIQVADGINPGELVVSVTAVKGARSYVHQYTQDPVTAESDWTHTTSTSSKYIFKNLDSAKRYWCRVAAVGAYEQVVISDPASRVVQ